MSYKWCGDVGKGAIAQGKSVAGSGEGGWGGEGGRDWLLAGVVWVAGVGWSAGGSLHEVFLMCYVFVGW